MQHKLLYGVACACHQSFFFCFVGFCDVVVAQHVGEAHQHGVPVGWNGYAEFCRSLLYLFFIGSHG